MKKFFAARLLNAFIPKLGFEVQSTSHPWPQQQKKRRSVPTSTKTSGTSPALDSGCREFLECETTGHSGRSQRNRISIARINKSTAWAVSYPLHEINLFTSMLGIFWDGGHYGDNAWVTTTVRASSSIRQSKAATSGSRC